MWLTALPIGQVLPSKASHSTLAQTDGAVPGGYRNTNKREYLVEIENDVNGVWPQSNIDPDLVTTSTLPMYSPPLSAAPSEDIFIYIVDIVNITNVHKYFQLSD